jgi:hypothetical protein
MYRCIFSYSLIPYLPCYYLYISIISCTCWVPTISVLSLTIFPCYSNLLLRRKWWTGILRRGVLAYASPRLPFLWCYGVFRCSIPLRVILVFKDIIYVINILYTTTFGYLWALLAVCVEHLILGHAYDEYSVLAWNRVWHGAIGKVTSLSFRAYVERPKRWFWTPSWTWTRQFWVGLVCHLLVHASLALQHLLDAPFILHGSLLDS